MMPQPYCEIGRGDWLLYSETYPSGLRESPTKRLACASKARVQISSFPPKIKKKEGIEMRGYKVFKPDWTCRGFQYSVGETFEEAITPICCKKGFHFCTELKDCFNYYSFDPNNKVAEIEALGDIDTQPNMNKHCTNIIKIVRELSWEEVLKAVNTGNSNTGFGNTGNYNSGNYNCGDWNSGNYNSGNYNTGKWNSGNRNAGRCNTGSSNTGTGNSGSCNSGYYNSGYYNDGDCNSGNYNTGKCNSGSYNSGFYNSGNCNSGNCNSGDYNKTSFSNGCFNTEKQKIFMFNKPSDWTIEDWHCSEAKRLLDNIQRMAFQQIWSEDMTEEEKEQHPEYKITNGYLRKLDQLECGQFWWNTLSDYGKNVIKSLPNFDAEIFKEITGIDINISNN